jgi:hypothetical protein
MLWNYGNYSASPTICRTSRSKIILLLTVTNLNARIVADRLSWAILAAKTAARKLHGQDMLHVNQEIFPKYRIKSEVVNAKIG